MVIYLSIIAYAIKDTETSSLLLSYALACGVGNYLEILWETWKIHVEYWSWEKVSYYQKKFRFYKIFNNYEGYIGKLHFYIRKKIK
jgi:hypothetical protein